MERYEQLAVVGEGSYGVVLKCRHRESDQIVAIKKFLETEEDAGVRRMALREIRMLKKLKHENLVTMIEVFRHRKRFYLVFEFLEGTVLDELEKNPGGLGDEKCRERIYQVTRAINYCHNNNIIHRDVKPENVLVSSLGVVKVCDFGFARLISATGEPCTEYVATRWYRAPELLVGEQQYGAPVDIWAIGCLFAEMMTGEPLFPGESDIDQLYLIVKTIGKPCLRHQQVMAKNSQMRGMMRSSITDYSGLYKNFSNWSLVAIDFLVSCMKMDPSSRPSSDDLLKHNFFTHDKFPQRFLPMLRERVNAEFNSNPLLRKYKAEILMATDKMDHNKVRRSLQIEGSRWRLNLIEGSVKRKFSCDNTELSTSRSTTKAGQRYSVIGSKHEKSLGDLESVKETEVQMMQKSLETMSKVSNRPSSEQKYEATESSNYQPLHTYHESSSKSNSLIMHPCINNIIYKESTKKSPNILQSIHATSIKGTFNQIPLLAAPKGTFLKRLDRNNHPTTESNFINIEPVNLGQPLSNTNSNTTGIRRSKEFKRNDFTLPVLPGATMGGSPLKVKGKSNLSPDPSSNSNPIITPRILSASSQKSSKNINILPAM